jgi:hypothetical protein
MTREDHLAAINGNADLIEGKYRFDMTFDEVMGDDTPDYDSANTKDLFFRGTPRLKRALNTVKFQYRTGYHNGVKRILRYGFSIVQHESHLQVEHIEQARITAGRGSTPEQREALIGLWAGNDNKLCKDLSRTAPINVTVKDTLASAISDNAEILGVCAGDLEIVMIYAALLRCEGLDVDIVQEGERFIASFHNAIANRSTILKECGGV